MSPSMAIGTDMEAFLAECGRSGDAAYAALKALLERLEDPSTRSAARAFLGDVQRRFSTADAEDACFARHHFRIHDVDLSNPEGHQKRKKLTMMEIPSIFIPEDWSFTFYEGINRHPYSIFRDKMVAELGCGNGWISIALAEKWCPLKVYGLDINPRAIKVAWINLYLNALDEHGLPIYDEQSKTLLDRVEFHESDLLAYCRDRSIELDRIIGCIPQILNPNPDAMTKMITENASEEFLYSLSNYCSHQGFVEDQFGLGLIARAVEESIAVIKPMGIMIFNMGGRPGQGVCERLFKRRGFQITRLWQTKVMQAADTDISALVEIENNSRHRFDFFMGLVGDKPICARTALAYVKSGGCISHALYVYSCQLRQPNQVKNIFDFLKNGFQDVGSSLDLSFADDSVADEKIPFLAYLASFLKENSFLPYDPPAGSMHFRDLIAGFMKNYHHIPLTADNVVVYPSRAVAIENTLRLFSPRLAVVDEQLTRHLPKQWLSLAIKEASNNESTGDAITVIEAPRQSDLLNELIKTLKPQIVITGIANFEAITSAAFENLLMTTREFGSRLFLDISDDFELSSLPGSNGVLKFLSGKTLPSHAAILCGLLKNQVYLDLEVAFVVSEEKTVYTALSKTLELLEGHTSLFSQFYYGCLFHELLAFQLDRHPAAERKSLDTRPTELIGFTDSATSSFNSAELAFTELKGASLVHMDVDQSFLEIPKLVKSAIFESFARQNLGESETDVRHEIQQLVRNRYGFSTDGTSEFLFADSLHSLFNKLVLCCAQEKGTLFFPSGGINGNYVSAAKFLKAEVVIVPTKMEEGFKLSPKTLAAYFQKSRNPWLYISGPTINPTGVLYSNEEIHEIFIVCAEFGVRVVLDTSFSGLEYRTHGWTRWDLDLENHTPMLKCAGSSFSVSLLGSFSSELLTGGFHFGYLILKEPALVDAFCSYPSLSQPHSTVRYAIKKLLYLYEHEDQQLSKAFNDRKFFLKARADILTETLKSCGWDVVCCSGGLSLVAKPTAYLGKTLMLDDGFDVKLDDSTLREAMLRATGLCINSGLWTGLSGYCRFTIALEDSQFETALRCITRFHKLVLGI